MAPQRSLGFEQGRLAFVLFRAELAELYEAATTLTEHVGGPVTPPEEGEEREYKVGANGRIGVPLKILGKRPGDTARVKYTRDQITIKS